MAMMWISLLLWQLPNKSTLLGCRWWLGIENIQTQTALCLEWTWLCPISVNAHLVSVLGVLNEIFHDLDVCYCLLGRMHLHPFLLLNLPNLLPIMSSAASVQKVFFVFIFALMKTGGGCRSHIKGFFNFSGRECALNFFSDEINLPEFKQTALSFPFCRFMCTPWFQRTLFILSDVQSSLGFFPLPLCLVSKPPRLPPFPEWHQH